MYSYRKYKWLAVFVAFTMILGFLPAMAGAVAHDPVPNYAFVPNALEASVSKVDLAADVPTEVARYSTIEPRPGDYAYDKYRVSRLAIDSGGNAWALNTMSGQSFAGYSTAQGSVARISATPVGADVTSTTGGLAGIVPNDDRVSYHDLGDPGDGPRTITIVEEGGEVYLWIGFYLGNYFEKYWYNEGTGELEIVVDAYIDVGTYTPYTAVLDGNGIMWVVSRNASPYPSPVGVAGVFLFDTNDLAADVTALPYDLPGKTGENPYAMVLGSDGRVWVSDGSNWNSNQERLFAVYTYGAPTTVEYISSGVSQAMRGFMEDADGNIWATTIDGQVLKGTKDNGGYAFATVFSGWGELAGIGMDYEGHIWVIRHGGDDMRRFDPANIDAGFITVGLGDGPYAYDNFIVPAVPETYGFCGYKYVDGVPAEGWVIELEVWDVGAFVPYLDEFDDQVTAITGPDGKYCFGGLLAGTYRVSEVLQDGYSQIFPANNEHIVVLPGGETPEDTILYGTQRNNPDNNGLYEINLDAGTSTRLFNAGGSGNSPNGLGFDPVNMRLYYTYVNETAPISSDLYFYDLDAGTETAAGLSMSGEVVVGASFFEGAYYYIPNLTADLHKVSLNPDGTVASDTVLWANFNGDNPAVYRFGDFAINRLGMLYASTNDTGGSTAEFFKLDVATGEYTLIADDGTLDAALLLQVSFGSDGTLYGHSAGTGEFFTINLDTGTKSSIGYVSSELRAQELFSDLASGFQPYDFHNAEDLEYKICGFKFEAMWDEVEEALVCTDIPIAGWEITLEKLMWDEIEGWVVDPSFTPLTELTAVDGSYCFEGLLAGAYRVSEETRLGYTPAGSTYYHDVILPEGASDGDGASYDFCNEPPQPVCYDDTIWAYGGEDGEFTDGAAEEVVKNNEVEGNKSNNWGWTNRISEGESYVFTLYAGAGQNDIEKGTAVGTLEVSYVNGCVEVTYVIDETLDQDYFLMETHLWIGDSMLPIFKGTPTAAPGQLSKLGYSPVIAADGLSATITVCDLDEDVLWIAAHGVVGWCEYPVMNGVVE